MGTIVSSPATGGLRRRQWALFALVLLLVGALGTAALIATRKEAPKPQSSLPIGGASASGQGSLISPPRTLTNFTMTSHRGTPLSLGELRGKAVLLFFGYTRCPDFCPTTLVEFRDVKRALGTEAAGVAFVFVSVDAESDTAETLGQYVTNFDPEFIGLRGDAATLAQIGPEYDLYFKKREVSGATGYLIDHTAITYLIDREGRLRIIFPYGTPAAAIATDIHALLAQP
ncbi:MAG: SCO family protein [Thermomicrobiales bacterium]